MKSYFKKFVVAILTLEATILLRRMKPTIIAVTGSVGKTSTKDAIFTVLRQHRRTRKSQKSYNSEIGIPLSILGIENAWNNPLRWLWNLLEGLVIALTTKDYPEVLVLEAGVDRPGDMVALASWLKPNIVVITQLPDVPVHVEYFLSPEDVAREKLTLLEALLPDGIFVYNYDDEKLQAAATAVRQRGVSFSRYVPSDITAGHDRVVYHDDVPIGTSFTLKYHDNEINVTVPGVVGIATTYTYAAAAAVATCFDIPLEAVATALAEHEPPAGRMRVLPGIKGTLVIDDTYNSSPIAAEAALRTLKEMQGVGRKIAVLGDMMELGRFSICEHERIGALVPECADILLTIGVRAQKIAAAALAHGLAEENIFQYEDAATAGRELQNLIQVGDVVLVKASQSIRAERVVEEIMAEPERASVLLVRQDAAWQER